MLVAGLGPKMGVRKETRETSGVKEPLHSVRALGGLLASLLLIELTDGGL